MAGAFTHNGNVIYGLPNDASQVNFNKTGTDLVATKVESAIKEVNTKVNTAKVALGVPDGSGKNILPLTIDNVKKCVNYAEWSGNSVTIKGVTYTLDVDDNGSVTKIHAEGTVTGGDAWLTLYNENTDFGDCVLSGCPSGGSRYTYVLATYKSNPSVWYYDEGSGVSMPNGVTIEQVYINIVNGYALPTGGIDFYPMIRHAVITDTAFTPYIPSVESRLETVESGLNDVNSNLTKIYHGTVTSDDTYGSISVPNATNSLIVLLGSASTLYHLDYNNPNVFILRDSNNYPVINTSVEIMAVYI